MKPMGHNHEPEVRQPSPRELLGTPTGLCFLAGQMNMLRLEGRRLEEKA